MKKLLSAALVVYAECGEYGLIFDKGRVCSLTAVCDCTADNCHLHRVYLVIILTYARPAKLVFIGIADII